MNSFDVTIISFFNQFSRHSNGFDYLVSFISQNNLIKGGVITIVLWILWYWDKNSEDQSNSRIHILATICGSFLAIIVARAMALLLPLRIRPLHEDALQFVIPYGMEKTVLDGWSSFPSDHATLFFALSFGILFVSKKNGCIYSYIFSYSCLLTKNLLRTALSDRYNYGRSNRNRHCLCFKHNPS